MVSKENLKNPKISYIFEKKTVLSIIGSKCENDNEKVFKEEEPIEILKVLSSINNMDDKNMVEENLSQEITLKNIMKQKIVSLKS